MKTQDLRIVGQPLLGRDAPKKVTGQAKYAADQVFPGMLYVRHLGSAYPHAIIRSIDTAEALAVPGVKAIITCFDIPQTKWTPAETRPLAALTSAPLCLGDEIAAVAATSLEAAEQAVSCIKVDYEVLPAVFDAQDALKDGAPQLHEDGNVSTPDGRPLTHEWGEVDKAFAEAAAIAQGRFKTPIQVHTADEPRSCVAVWDGHEMHLWAATQFPHQVRNDVAAVLGLPQSKVQVKYSFVGGGFGGKKQERLFSIAALLSQKTGRPVKYAYTREDEHIIGRRRAALTADMALACNANGDLTGIKFDGWYDVGAYGNWIGGSLLLILSQAFLYKYGSGRFTAWDTNTNLITAQPFRGVQAPPFQFCFEQLMDELAQKMNIDPTDFRLRNTYRSNERTEPFGEVLSTYAIEECVTKGKELFKWSEKWPGWNARKAEGTKRRGIGMATSFGWCDWMREAAGAVVEVHKDGSATLITGTTDLGTHSKTTLTQILAEALSLPYEKVDIVAGDTGATPYDFGACASRTVTLGGLCTLKAAENIREQILELAAEKMVSAAEDIYLEDGVVKSQSTDESLPLAHFLNGSLFATGNLDPNEELSPLHPTRYIGGASAQFAEVEVDTETGEVKVLRLVAVHDAGRAINPVVVESQIEGALIMGMGYALTEQLRFDPTANHYLEDTYADYKILTIGDVPKIATFVIEPHEPLGPYGAKGVGEHALNCTAGAIANAIRDAVGVQMPEIPMTPERVLERLESSQNKGIHRV